ncbi:glycosyltransferase [Cladorrhinum sp. PSN332]|nr:glycosyltransferase [Cladorrhinum sp. PSN332]
MSDGTRPVDSDKVWTTLITNTSYLPGLLTLHFSLLKSKSRYPLIALYTDSFPASALTALHARQILTQHINTILPTSSKSYSNDPRFADCWTKLVPFSLTQYARIIQLDSDMLILRNMDELFDIPLNSTTRIFAAGHACVCNPLHKPHYPSSWKPSKCAFTSQSANSDLAQQNGGDPLALSPELSYCNGGLQVVQPSLKLWDQIQAYMNAHASELDFADQSVLSEVFKGRWVALPYVYNALKTMRWDGVHNDIWRDEEVKNVHYILTPKPWEEEEQEDKDESKEETHKWWKDVDAQRKRNEKERGISDEWS